MAISVDQVRELRERTGAGVLDAKKALEASAGNMDAAIQSLREKGLAAAAKKAGRTASQGLVLSYIHGDPGRIGVLLELNCETDFVARTDAFRQLAHNVAMHIAAANPEFVSVEDVPESTVAAELATYTTQLTASGKTPDIAAKAAEGRVAKWKEMVVLLEQPYVRDPDTSVGNLIKSAIAELGENILVGRFARFELGQGG